jgi:tRNA pseudouridine38-40 synthase
LQKILLKIEYDGANYCGWQIQPNRLSIEEVVEQKLQIALNGLFTKVNASSRTDSGVHSYGLVASIQIPKERSLPPLFISLNALLPKDIGIVDMVEVPLDFNPRKNEGKRYIYQINNSRIEKSIDRDVYWWVRTELDREKMEVAAKQMLGIHDFAAFQAKGCSSKSTIRKMRSIELKWEQVQPYQHLKIIVEGSSFLRNMVRIMAGSLVDIGRGKIPEDAIQKSLQNLDRTALGITAPAQNLFLEHVFYNPDPFILRNGKTWNKRY